MSQELFTRNELLKFDSLTLATSSQNGYQRIAARLELTKYIKEHGREKCDAMFAVLQKRDAKRKGAA